MNCAKLNDVPMRMAPIAPTSAATNIVHLLPHKSPSQMQDNAPIAPVRVYKATTVPTLGQHGCPSIKVRNSNYLVWLHLQPSEEIGVEMPLFLTRHRPRTDCSQISSRSNKQGLRDLSICELVQGRRAVNIRMMRLKSCRTDS